MAGLAPHHTCGQRIRLEAGAAGQYAFDTLRAGCLKNPLACPPVTGGTAVVSIATLGRALDTGMKTSIREAMEECADKARTEVLLRHQGTFEGLVPKAAECKAMTVDAEGRSVTWAMRLGLEMHEVALACAQAKLSEMGLKFSLKPRYRFNRATKEKSLISPEEKAAMLKRGGEELKGTLELDVVIHTGDPLQVLAVFDFKFRCVGFDKPPKWRTYPEGHRYARKSQGQIYEEAFGPEVHIIGPRKGVFW